MKTFEVEMVVVVDIEAENAEQALAYAKCGFVSVPADQEALEAGDLRDAEGCGTVVRSVRLKPREQPENGE